LISNPPVRGVLADLDDTLFDHRHATRAALGVLHAEVPAFQAWAAEEFASRHSDILELLHQAVLAGRLTVEDARVMRFQRLLDAAAMSLQSPEPPPYGPRPTVAARDLARRYREQYEMAWQAVPGAIALATALKQAGVAFVIVTNNVTREQQLKLERCGLLPFVDALITSEDVGVTKPDARIFDAALAAARATPAEAVMLGDSWPTDVAGARASGLRAVWLNRAGAAAPDTTVAEIRSLEPLPDVWRVLIGST
jgi:putative hydrolase of the HAD superfamily